MGFKCFFRFVPWHQKPGYPSNNQSSVYGASSSVPWHQKPGYPSNVIFSGVKDALKWVPWHQKPGYPSNILALSGELYGSVPWHQKPGYPSNHIYVFFNSIFLSSVTSKAGLPFKREECWEVPDRVEFRDIKSRATLQTYFSWPKSKKTLFRDIKSRATLQTILSTDGLSICVPWHQKPGYPSNIESGNSNISLFRDIKSRATLQTETGSGGGHSGSVTSKAGLPFKQKLEAEGVIPTPFRDIKSRATLQTEVEVKTLKFVPWHQKPGYPSNLNFTVEKTVKKRSVTSKAGLPFKRRMRGMDKLNFVPWHQKPGYPSNC